MTAIKIEGDAIQIVRAIEKIKSELDLKRRQLESEFSTRMSEYTASRQVELRRHLSGLEAIYSISSHGPGTHVLDTRYLEEHGLAFIVLNREGDEPEEPIMLSRELN